MTEIIETITETTITKTTETTMKITTEITMKAEVMIIEIKIGMKITGHNIEGIIQMKEFRIIEIIMITEITVIIGIIMTIEIIEMIIIGEITEGEGAAEAVGEVSFP